MSEGPHSHSQIRELLSRFETLLSELKEAVARLEEQALRDELTGLYNRRALDQRLEEEVHRALRHNRCFSLLFIDVDDFKDLNDSYGHYLGDQVLREIGQTLLANGRAMDVFFRYGGEEFVAILPETKASDALKVAERVRRAVAEHPFAGGAVQVTVSVGVAAFPDHGESVSELLKAADRAQYRAKGRGKNRVYTVGDGDSGDNASHRLNCWLLATPPPGEVRVAVGFSQGQDEPSALWVDGELQPIESATPIGALGAGADRRYVVATGAGRFELFRRDRGWFLRPLWPSENATNPPGSA